MSDAGSLNVGLTLGGACVPGKAFVEGFSHVPPAVVALLPICKRNIPKWC